MFVSKNPRNFLIPTKEEQKLKAEEKVNSIEEKSADKENSTAIDNRGIEVPRETGPVTSDVFNPIPL
jgi:predicted ATPase